jgi:hypothetical protein
MAPRTEKPGLRSLPAEVPEFIVDKAEKLVKQVRPLGHPRAYRQDVIAALIDAASPETTAKALEAYNPKLGKVLHQMESD